jgi:F0F1-type ATP synthase membrane subunit a
VSRIFSLAIRLFANMLSGHILLKILISFVWAIVSSNMVHWIWNVLPMSIVFSVIGLEISIAFLQAYVFIVLITIYLKDVIHTH